MSQIILDISANTFKNDFHLIAQLIDKIKDIDTGKHEIIFKTQLFRNCPPNIPCHYQSLKFLMNYARTSGYKVTSSIFDKESLRGLLKYDTEIPFIKIPCRHNLYWLVGEVPRDIPVYISYDDSEKAIYEITKIKHLLFLPDKDIILYCIPKYPASIKDYEGNFDLFDIFSIGYGISDHTPGLELFKKYKFKVWEKHYVLEHDKNNPDAGEFAVTPENLKEIL